MADRQFEDVQGLTKGGKLLVFSFAPNGTSAVSAASNKGKGLASVARTSTGAFTVTLDDAYYDLIGSDAAVRLAAPADTVAQLGTYDSSTKTIALSILTAGTLADVAANANNRVSIWLLMQNSEVT